MTTKPPPQRALVKPRLLSVQETAIALSLGVTSVYALIANGKLDAIKVGDRNLVKVDAIERFIAKQPAAVIKPPRRASRKRRLG